MFFNVTESLASAEITTSWPTCVAWARTLAKLSKTLLLNWTVSCPAPVTVKPSIVEWPKLGANTNVSFMLLLLLNRKSSPPVPFSVLVLLAARITAPELVSTAWPVLSNSWALIV